MKVKSTLIFLCLVSFSFVLLAQESIQFSPKDLQHITKRWSKYHPKAEVLLRSGDTIQGQPIHFDMHELLIFPSDSLPLDLEGFLISIPFGDIDQVFLEKGGPVTPGLASGIIIGIGVGIGIGAIASSPGAALILGNVVGVLGGMAGKAAQKGFTTAELELEPSNINYMKEITKLQKWSVFKDSVIFTSDINLLPVYSGAMRRLYPQKHLRISLGLNWGFNSLQNDMKDVFDASGLPPWEYYNHNAMGFEYLDLSWRFNYHWIVGGGLMTNQDPLAFAYSYQVYGTGNEILDYSYSVSMTDFRVYTEYVLSPVNRFLTDRTEFTVGGGFILSRPHTYVNYTYLTDPATGATDYFYSDEFQTIFGFQARASAYLYLFRNFSLSGGVEMNIYQNLEMPAFSLSSENPKSGTVLNAHTLNYSTVRLKIGAHLYF
jgi:hypothetical protein